MSVPAHYAVIERLAAAAKAEIREMAQIARFELGIPLRLYLDRQHEIALPKQLKCPECGGPLFAQIDEWETADGYPCGVMVGCYAEIEELFQDDDPSHMHMWYDWELITRRAERFVCRRVRIVT